MAFSFGNLNTSIRLKDQSLVVENIELYSLNRNKDRHILFLTDYYPEPKKIQSLITLIKKVVDSSVDWDLVSASSIKASPDKIKKDGVTKFFKRNKSDFSSYIKSDRTIIVSLGRAINAITQSSDISVECFYDYIFNKTYFYSPEYNVNVFPVDGIDSLLRLSDDKLYYRPKDSSRVEFFKLQMISLNSKFDEYRLPEPPIRPRIIKIKSKEEFTSFVYAHAEEAKVAWDIETTGFSFKNKEIICLSFSFGKSTGYYVPWKYVDIPTLSEFFKNKKQIGQNLKFDIKFLKFRGVKNLKIHSDALQLGQHLNEMRFNGLKSLAYYYTCYGGYDKDLDEYKEKYKPKHYGEIPEEVLSNYAVMDAIVTYEVEEVMQRQLTYLDLKFPPGKGLWTLRDFYEKVKIPTVNNFIDIELRGVYVNKEIWNRNADELNLKILEKKQLLKKHLMLDVEDESFVSMFDVSEDEDSLDELQSGKQLGEILENLGWECLGRTKNGWYKSGDEELKRWLQLGHEEATIIQDMRSYLTMQKTFLGRSDSDEIGWKRYIDEYEDGSSRISPSYKSTLMDTHRNGCGDPNYQQIPSGAKDAQLMKQVLTTPDISKYYLLTLDYSSFQMRLAAIDSEDPVLCDAYRKDPYVDMHVKTAYNVFMKGSEFEIEEIIFSEGLKTIKKFPNEEINIIREGNSIKVKASEVVDSDIIEGLC